MPPSSFSTTVGRVAATGSFDVALIELADEDRDSSAEFDILGTGWPPVPPCFDGESVVWCG
jgi:hypothetical protein